MTNSKTIPVTVNFDDNQLPVAFVTLADAALAIPNLHEYVISPVALVNEETKEVELIGYGLIHYTKVPSEEVWKQKMKDVGIA